MSSAAIAHTTQFQPLLSPADVARLLDVCADADRAITAELYQLITSRTLISRATVARIERLLEEVLWPAVTVRELIERLPRDQLGQALAQRHALRQRTDPAAS